MDLWNGTPAQLGSFQQQTGATFPLALLGDAPAGGNVELLYGPYDNYLVLNGQGIVRYHAALRWPHGNRYHPDEIRACVDTLVVPVLDVPGGGAGGLALAAGPSPARGAVRVSLAHAAAASSARVTVHDVAGRTLVTLHRGPLPAGRLELHWDARDAQGARVPPGLYLVRAEVGSEVRVRRVVVTR